MNWKRSISQHAVMLSSFSFIRRLFSHFMDEQNSSRKAKRTQLSLSYTLHLRHYVICRQMRSMLSIGDGRNCLCQ